MGQKKVLEIQVLWKGKRLGVDVSWVPNALPDFFKLSHQCGEHLFLASFYRWLTGLYGGQVICLRSSKWNNSKAWADWRSEAKMELGWARSPHLLGLQEQMVSTFSYTCEQVHGPCSSLVFCFYSQEAFWAHFWLFAACTQHSEKRHCQGDKQIQRWVVMVRSSWRMVLCWLGDQQNGQLWLFPPPIVWS